MTDRFRGRHECCARSPLRPHAGLGRAAGHFEAHGRDLDLREAFAATRALRRFSLRGARGLRRPVEEPLIDIATRRFLLDLAHECRLAGRGATRCSRRADQHHRRPRRAAHRAARAARGGPLQRRGARRAGRDAGLRRAVRADVWAAAITDVVNIGIGGSDLGPQMVVPALDAWVHRGLQLHFVSNVDGHDIAPVLRGWTPRRTLFIVASKTFTTQETMANAQVARQWFLATARGGRPTSPPLRRHHHQRRGGGAPSASHHLRLLGLGGRALLAVERHRPADRHRHRRRGFRALLAGAHAMDRHFAEAPLEANLPLQLGLLDVWYRNFHGFTSRSRGALPPGPARLPAYLQQLEMEQRQVRRPGGASRCPAAPARWSGASPAPTASMPTSRCCTRAPT
jgi:glucose-6-phosphate isomerase